MYATQLITVEFKFCAAHRLLGHEGRCRFVHGHNYKAIVTLAGRQNALGMVADFADVKKYVGGWIDENWDHNIILNPFDPLFHCSVHPRDYSDTDIWKGKLPYAMSGQLNPTAENMAVVLAKQIEHLTDDAHPLRTLKLRKVVIEETESCSAAVEIGSGVSYNLENL